MGDEILQFLSRYVSFTEEEIAKLRPLNTFKSYKKGEILLHQGEISPNCYFVLSGCVRSYYLIDGEEKTTAFFTEGHPITPVCYIKKEPSEYYLTCVEDCILSTGSPEQTVELFKAVPKIQAVADQISNDLLAKSQENYDNFVILTPEQRYLRVLETRPELVNRVPLYQLASYLGVKPETLSRIRKRISEQGKHAG